MTEELRERKIKKLGDKLNKSKKIKNSFISF